MNRQSTGQRWLDDNVYKLLSASAVGVVALATVVYHWLEDWSWVDSLYFSVVAVTTVGFGDLAPTTDAAKLVTVAYIVIGLSIVASFLNARLGRRAQRMANRRQGEDG
jgi:Ion channel